MARISAALITTLLSHCSFIPTASGAAFLTQTPRSIFTRAFSSSLFTMATSSSDKKSTASSPPVSRKDLIRKLLKGIETGDPAAAAVVSEERYIQHNPQTHEGGEGLAALFARLSKSNPHVNIVRAFEDGDYVIGHTEYDFSTRRIGFEVFRFDGNLAVEHWDNIQPRKGPNAAGRSMVDGPTEANDLDQTEVNRELVRQFVQRVMVDKTAKLEDYLQAGGTLIQHSPDMTADGLAGLQEYFQRVSIRYETIHRVLAEGNFVLVVSEGYRDDVHTSFYDLYRVSKGKLVEHWDTVEAVPPLSEWKNQNGKF